MKRENRAAVKVYFEDGASLTWSIKPGSPAATNRRVMAEELAKFAAMVSPSDAPTAIRIGSRWRDNDPRQKVRTVEVVAVSIDKVSYRGGQGRLAVSSFARFRHAFTAVKDGAIGEKANTNGPLSPSGASSDPSQETTQP